MRGSATIAAGLALALGATAAWATMDCADYISGTLEGGPMTGHLIGEQLVTEEFTFGVDAGLQAGLTGTVQYTVGFYRMDNGKTISVDCRTYTAV